MHFREQFSDDADLYMKATENTKLTYSKLAKCLAEWQDPLQVGPSIKIIFNL